MKKFTIKKGNSLQDLDSILSGQSKRIEELKKENAELKKALDDYRKKENEIAETLKVAKIQADSITGEAKVKYALECERLKLFSEKWTAIFKSGPQKIAEAAEKTDKLLRQSRLEIEDMLITSFGKGMEGYQEERNRLNRTPLLNYNEIVKEEKEKIVEELPLDDLEELLKQL